MALIIGSTALHFNFSDSREPKDLDFFAPPEQVPSYLKAKVGEVEPFWHESWRGTIFETAKWEMATPDQLYTIKVSHAYWELKNGSWDKHLKDIIFLKNHGAKLDMELHKLLYPVWTEVHGKKKMNLAQAAGDFFDDAVVRIYDHDSIHSSVAYGDHAMYERILKDGDTVDIDPVKLWEGLNFTEQVMLFREEIAATALERWMIPTKYKFSPGLAWKLALRKTITSLTKGKSARFIVDNFQYFCKPHNYMSIHYSKMDRLIPLDKNNKGMM